MGTKGGTPTDSNDRNSDERSSWLSRFHRRPSIVPIAAAILGGAVGSLTGLSGPNATVLAAVLPAVLTVVASVAGFVANRKNGKTDSTQLYDVSGLIILFMFAFLVCAFLAVWERKRQDTVGFNTVEARKELGRCIDLESSINKARDEIGRPPFFIQDICPDLDKDQAHKAQKAQQDRLRIEDLRICTINELMKRRHKTEREIQKLRIRESCPSPIGDRERP